VLRKRPKRGQTAPGTGQRATPLHHRRERQRARTAAGQDAAHEQNKDRGRCEGGVAAGHEMAGGKSQMAWRPPRGRAETRQPQCRQPTARPPHVEWPPQAHSRPLGTRPPPPGAHLGLRRALLVRLHGGEDAVDLGLVVLRLLCVRRDISRCVARTWAVSSSSFNINSFSTEESLSLFGFKLADVRCVAGLLEVQGGSSRRRYKATPVEQLCVVLRRLSSPARWRDLEILFGRGRSSLCELFYETIQQMDVSCSGLLCSWRGDLMEERAEMYAQRVLEKGGALDNCVGFIDGTGLFVARPGGAFQRSVYSGHKRTHMLLAVQWTLGRQ